MLSTTQQYKNQNINEYIEYMVQTYSDIVYRVARNILYNRDYAEDVVQDVFFKLVQSRPKFESNEHEKAWMLRVTVNISKNYNKKQIHSPTVELQENLASYEITDESLTTSIVNVLPDKYKHPLLLHYLYGYKIAEISKMTNQSQSAVLSLLLRSRKQLKQLINQTSEQSL